MKRRLSNTAQPIPLEHQKNSIGGSEVKMEEIRKNQIKKDGTHNNNNKEGVIISVYVESPTRNYHEQNSAVQVKRNMVNPNGPRSVAKSPGYDRRAQLLAYSQELRNADSPEVQLPRNNSRPKPKWKWSVKSATPATRRISSRRSRSGECRYQRLTRGMKVEVVDQISCRPKCFDRRKNNKASSWKTSSAFLRKVKGYAGRVIRWF